MNTTELIKTARSLADNSENPNELARTIHMLCNRLEGKDVPICTFTEAWIGRCKNEGYPFCEEHSGCTCNSCGAVAVMNCDSTIGPLVCGSNLCADCEHELDENGTNGGTFKHCRKDAQKYEPWYAREVEATT
jgi:hypothetical protein